MRALRVVRPGDPAPSNERKALPRFWQLDAARGFAVLLMILFHFSFDLNAALGGRLDFPSWYWSIVPDGIGLLFLTIVGVSARLSYERNPSFRSFAKRSIRLGACALLISAVTLTLSPETPIYFGVLHCIAVCLFLVFPFLNKTKTGFKLGLPLAALGFYLMRVKFEVGWFFWLGFQGPSGRGEDWYPLIPWFGVVLVGAHLGERLLPWIREGGTRFALRQGAPLRAISFIGRHALVIYLVHQPVMIGLLSLAR